jgi:hypothetical protein
MLFQWHEPVAQRLERTLDKREVRRSIRRGLIFVYGECSSTVEYLVVVLAMKVRFLSSAQKKTPHL